MSKTLRLFSPYVLAFVFVSIVCGLVYVAQQQSIRQGANDPQIHMAEDAARWLTEDNTPAAVVPRGVPLIDPSKSLEPFIAVYDKNLTALESSGVVNGKPPMPPSGVFATATARGEYRVTWQPAGGTRIAAVIVPVNGKFQGFVLAGRSLLETEKRQSQLIMISALAWLVLLGISFFGIFVLQKKNK